MIPGIAVVNLLTRHDRAAFPSAPTSVRPGRLLRRHLDQLDIGPEGQGGRDHQRPLRVSHHGAERRSRRHPSQGYACGPHDAARSRDLDDRAPDEALKLQLPLPDGTLRIVARGVKEDPAFAGLSNMNTFVSDPDS